MCTCMNVIMMILLLLAAFKDMKKRSISLRLLVILSIFTLLSTFLQKENVWDIFGGAAIGLLFFLISKCTGEQIGYGDSWLILVLGVYAGAKALIWILFAASFGAGLFSLCFCAIHKWNRRYSIPFIPFLAAAFLGVVIL